MTSKIVWFDTETTTDGKNLLDIGAIKVDDSYYHGNSVGEFLDFIKDSEFVCGHNIVHHDMPIIEKLLGKTLKSSCIDTLFLSPLLFPKRPYHKLLKDDKILTEELNNPVNDSKKAKELFDDEIKAFVSLPDDLKKIYYGLLQNHKEFSGLFNYLNYQPSIEDLTKLIKSTFSQQICKNADVSSFVTNNSMELAYALALINTGDYNSITPPWVIKNNPQIENIIRILRNTPCKDENCVYCRSMLNAVAGLKKFFGFDSFRTYNGEPLQQKAAEAAIAGKSLLAIFPTGGGKSITFQVPALLAGQCSHGLTVVISPLQSLMKDQVDNLIAKNGITDAVYINGLLNPVERKSAIEQVENGIATMLYISPEQLRSKTIEKLLQTRNVVRFVIDEAHCFSAWGQDFRVDYLYIGKFIRELQKIKNNRISVSCFTATAKQKVISDIKDYFKKELDLDLELFTTTTERKNLQYRVVHVDVDSDKYNILRGLIEAKNCPTIIYVSRTKKTLEIAERLTKDGFFALPFNGKMETQDKVANQDSFMKGECNIIVATSAFGMGVDKSDVKLVIHYDISDSLENYVQEAGRAGRDQSLEAECYVLFNDNDLNKHFILLNQTKLSIGEIQQVWQAIKSLTNQRPNICCSPLEIAREAGWNDSVKDLETRIKTAITALENAGYVERGKNIPRVYATSINASSMIEAGNIIDESNLFLTDEDRDKAKNIIRKLISSRSRANADYGEAESRIDYIADHLGLDKKDVINSINTMRQAKLLKNDVDMEASISKNDTRKITKKKLSDFSDLERFILSLSEKTEENYSLKELNENAQKRNINSNLKNIRIILYFLNINGYLGRIEDKANQSIRIGFKLSKNILFEKQQKRINCCNYIIERIYDEEEKNKNNKEWNQTVTFSMVKMFEEYKKSRINSNISLKDFEEALLYLSKIGAIRFEGGFLVIYNSLEIKRLIKDNKIKYKKEHYRMLDEFYKNKIQQIHIVGEFANLMQKSYEDALKYVKDYFMMDYKKFIKKYFKGIREEEIERNITSNKFNELFDILSEKQKEIIVDSESKYISVVAGPGSGKTMLLVHKLASLILLEDIKYEQLLMLTFSRAAATEFKLRLKELIGNAANFVEIKTFHSYCFDLLGRKGNIEASDDIIKEAAIMIEEKRVENNKIAKRVLVIDEAQDMDANQYRLVNALKNFNVGMKIIAVGDDDQNIYGFRGSSSEYMLKILSDDSKEDEDTLVSKRYEMITNYRSKANIVNLCNKYLNWLENRFKKEEIQSYTKENGIVNIFHYNSSSIIEGLIENICETHKDGRDCILTNTNDEALQVYTLLCKKGIPVRLIQSADKVKLNKVIEIQDFITKLYNNKSSIINKDDWENGKKYINDRYKDSSILEICNNLFSKFESLYPETMYLNDFEEFILQSNYEDFYTSESKTMLVSTMHKAKGKEFDNVYILLDNFNLANITNENEKEEKKRQLYVAMTRAKSGLFIHCNTNIFKNCNVPNVDIIENNKKYDSPKEIALQMEYRDFYLDYSFKVKDVLKDLRSGEKLEFAENGLVKTIKGKKETVALYSKSFREKLIEYIRKGYKPIEAEIRFMVSWTKTNDNQNEVREIDSKPRTAPVILANLYMKK